MSSCPGKGVHSYDGGERKKADWVWTCCSCRTSHIESSIIQCTGCNKSRCQCCEIEEKSGQSTTPRSVSVVTPRETRSTYPFRIQGHKICHHDWREGLRMIFKSSSILIFKKCQISVEGLDSPCSSVQTPSVREILKAILRKLRINDEAKYCTVWVQFYTCRIMSLCDTACRLIYRLM
jgi:hypothetical protein